jgi:hypothetical protein
MMRSGVVLGIVAALAGAALTVEPFAAQGTRQAASPDPRRPETTELEGRLIKLQERTQRLEEQVARLKTDNDRLSAGLERARANAANFLQQLKPLVEAQARLARSVAVDPSGAVRITGNLRLENNVLEEGTVVNCDPSSLSGQRQCTCPDGLVATGIELRPLATSAYPGPATYNTSLVCSRL